MSQEASSRYLDYIGLEKLVTHIKDNFTSVNDQLGNCVNKDQVISAETLESAWFDVFNFTDFFVGETAHRCVWGDTWEEWAKTTLNDAGVYVQKIPRLVRYPMMDTVNEDGKIQWAYIQSAVDPSDNSTEYVLPSDKPEEDVRYTIETMGAAIHFAVRAEYEGTTLEPKHYSAKPNQTWGDWANGRNDHIFIDEEGRVRFPGFNIKVQPAGSDWWLEKNAYLIDEIKYDDNDKLINGPHEKISITSTDLIIDDNEYEIEYFDGNIVDDEGNIVEGDNSGNGSINGDNPTDPEGGDNPSYLRTARIYDGADATEDYPSIAITYYPGMTWGEFVNSPLNTTRLYESGTTVEYITPYDKETRYTAGLLETVIPYGDPGEITRINAQRAGYGAQ